jgi:hypothetical protein
MELRFTVWQFVRLMVHLESHPDAQFDAWKDVWETLDADLGTLSTQDNEAFSDMMMNQDVVIEDATKAQALAAQTALSAVMGEIETAITEAAEATEQDSEHLQGLKFERRELRQLARKLGRMAEAQDA